MYINIPKDRARRPLRRPPPNNRKNRSKPCTNIPLRLYVIVSLFRPKLHWTQQQTSVFISSQKAEHHQRKTVYDDQGELHIVPESKPDKDPYFFRAGAMLGTDPNLWVTFGENDHKITQIVPRWSTEPIFPETKEQWRA